MPLFSRTAIATLLSVAFLPTTLANELNQTLPSDSTSQASPFSEQQSNSPELSTTPEQTTNQGQPVTQDEPVTEQPSTNSFSAPSVCVAPSSNDEELNQTVHIAADSIDTDGTNSAVYQGDVVITQGKKQINADTITLDQSKDSVTANGTVIFNDGQIRSVSDSVKSDLKGTQTELNNTQYKLLCESARGTAAYILKDGQAIYTMTDGSLTTCPDENKSWRVKASTIDIDNNEEEATFYNTRFEILDVPVFYWPYVTVPIGDKRKTGFLFPTAGYGTRNGLELNIPIYFNLAPNYDLTTTINYLDKRGVLFANDFRYLTEEFGESELKVEYLNEDDENKDLGSRWGFNYTHEGIYDENWKFDIDYSRVSDDTYLDDDLGSDVGEREDGQLLQEGEIEYRTENSNTTLLARDFQELTDANPYKVLPSLSFDYHAPEIMKYLDFDLESEVARFETDDDDRPDATRIHIEPGLTVPLYNSWGRLTSEAKLMYTHYDQDLKNGDAKHVTSNGESHTLSSSADRLVPEYRLNGSLFLDNEQTIFGDYTQTLEPQIQYLYIPDIEQDDIFQGYDTTLMQSDYYGLFRDREYSSIDRIEEANQFSYGATSRFYDADFKERFNLSVGQIFYLNPTNDRADFSAWAVENEWNISEDWLYKGSLQYDTDVSKMQLASSVLEYQLPKGGHVQLNYRFVNKDYISDNAPDISESQLDRYTRDGIEQLGLLTSFDITNRWSLKAEYFHDLTENEMLEGLVSLNYTDDCWYMGVTYTRRIESSSNVSDIYPEPGPDYESNYSLNIGIKGLGLNAGYIDDDGGNSLSYSRPFSLND